MKIALLVPVLLSLCFTFDNLDDVIYYKQGLYR